VVTLDKRFFWGGGKCQYVRYTGTESGRVPGGLILISGTVNSLTIPSSICLYLFCSVLFMLAIAGVF